jgi:acetolactate synthase-1/2/3 large subunit
VVDESLTSGGSYWEMSKGCPPFSHLNLTGGSIGFGPPAAVGAAVACPHRTVINFQVRMEPATEVSAGLGLG